MGFSTFFLQQTWNVEVLATWKTIFFGWGSSLPRTLLSLPCACSLGSGAGKGNGAEIRLAWFEIIR